ncbi:DUF4397 domain-containing protein [Pseudoalteromonas tunicata]|jgi:hypothetical protein|uniref:DUF4397 domain-containing protein n=1 Tax=Pseudoalteromonas tunicata D2 TaxID=87626 RepID=A4C3G4_9GAMM|nr:DUF4397 domain-containing protein [Pseudoalteromonas tunicata]ATC96623.1 hypothetical protein PTUN_b0184 [Pseudoalteromonas tunicata]AXT32801.1 DUF4397 domain-containing protein [Pseudoalteromonas tunicata]EAR30096.1 hypothetical protein PTD2_00966 [Pseudoalteromonas tunicata D2]
MKKIVRTLSLIALATTLVACNDDDDKKVEIETPPPAPVVKTYLRVLHASADAPLVNVKVNNNIVVEGADYSVGSTFFELDAASYSVAVDAILPDETATVIGPVDLDLMGNKQYSVVALGTVAKSTLEPLIISRDVTELASGNVRLQVLHGAPDVPQVDVYVTPPDVALSNENPLLSNVAYKTYSDALDVPVGDYQVRITLTGQKDVVYDSGTLALGEGTDLLVVAVPNTKTGTSPVMLLAQGKESTNVIADKNAPSHVRAIHAVADAPAVNLVVDDTITALTDVPFKAVSDYLPLSPTSHNFKVEPSAAVGTYVVDADVTLDKSVHYSVFVAGQLADNSQASWPVVDMPRRVATEAKVRIFHAAPNAPQVDLYVTSDNDISDDTAAFSNVPFKAETGYVSLKPGTYYVTATVAGTKDAAIGPVMLTFEGGKIYSAAAVESVGGGLPLSLITMDDF